MKSIIRVLGLVVLCGLLFFLGTKLIFTQERQETKPPQLSKSQDTTRQETYVSKVIISVPWAKKNLVYDGEESPPGEFGLHAIVFPESLREELPAPPLPEGPVSFTVALNGDIYITDPLNKRIQRFDANGNFVSVIPIPHFEGSKYVQAYQYEWSLICADLNHNVYLLWWEDYTEQTLCKYDQQGNLLNTYPFFPEVRIGGGGKLYCDDSVRLFFEYPRKESDKIILSLKEYLLSKRPDVGYTFQIGTADQVFAPEEQEATLRKGVREIPNWSKIKKLRDLKPPGEGLELSHTWNRDFVDEKGNYYLYWSTKEGITITKWYKQ